MNRIVKKTLFILILAIPASFSLTMLCMLDGPSGDKWRNQDKQRQDNMEAISDLLEPIEKKVKKSERETKNYIYLLGASLITSYFFYKYPCQENKTLYLGLSFAIPASAFLSHKYTPFKNNRFYIWKEEKKYVHNTSMLVNPLCSIGFIGNATRKQQELYDELDMQWKKAKRNNYWGVD